MLPETVYTLNQSAIGGVVAGVLAREGYKIQLVVKHPELAGKINNNGIEIEGESGNFIIQVPSVALTDELSGTFDYVLIATKADGLVEAARGMLPFLHLNSRVVSMQNGICEEMLADVVGGNRTIGCVVGFGGTMHEPGRVEMTSGGELIIGNWKRERDEELEGLAHILDHVVDTRVSGEIFQELYSKLIINACVPTLGAICGQYLGDMLANRNNRKLKSSSLQSLERGRKTEVENYNGYIASKGRELDVATPVNEQLTHMVEEIEQGKRQINPENFKEITSLT